MAMALLMAVCTGAMAATLNAYTVMPEKYASKVFEQFTKDTGIKVNTIHPGYVQTDMNKAGDQQNGELSVPEGARTSVRLALIGNDGPTGGFFYFDQVLPW